MSGQREATEGSLDELRRAIHFVKTHEEGTFYLVAILAEAVERVLDVEQPPLPAGDEPYTAWWAGRDTGWNEALTAVRAALLGES